MRYNPRKGTKRNGFCGVRRVRENTSNSYTIITHHNRNVVSIFKALDKQKAKAVDYA